MNYIIITPAKNEEKYIENTLRSVCAQTLKPKEWIIVNDGSTDKTEEIIKKYLKDNPWIKLININTRGEKRAVGSKVVRAFYKGYNTIGDHSYDFIVKLDADLALPTNYFKIISEEFSRDNKLGIGGGAIVYYNKDNQMIKEKVASYHVRGALKTYRRQCFKEIDGLKSVLGWDGIDEMTAMYLGWKVKVIDNLTVIHHRPTGYETGKYKHGYIAGKLLYGLGYDPFLALLGAIKTGLYEKPYIIKGMLVYFGYFISTMHGDKKVVSRNLGKFVREFQYNRIKKFLYFFL